MHYIRSLTIIYITPDARSWATDNATHQTLTLCSLIVTNSFLTKLLPTRHIFCNSSYLLELRTTPSELDHTIKTIPKTSYLND